MPPYIPIAKARGFTAAFGKEWYSIKRVAAMNGIEWRKFDWRALKNTSYAMNKPTPKIFDANYGTVNTYHIDVFKAVYPDFIYGDSTDTPS